MSGPDRYAAQVPDLYGKLRVKRSVAAAAAPQRQRRRSVAAAAAVASASRARSLARRTRQSRSQKNLGVHSLDTVPLGKTNSVTFPRVLLQKPLTGRQKRAA